MQTKLTGKEQAVLDFLMNSDTSLTASKIVAGDSDFSNNTVQSVLRSLLKKGYVEVANIVYSGTVLCRSYCLTQKARDSKLRELTLQFQNLRKCVPVPQIFAGLISNEPDEQIVIAELEALLAEKKMALGKGDE